MDPEQHPTGKIAGLISIILFWIAGVDGATMRHCPPRDWDFIRTTGILMGATFTYLTGLFFALGHHLFPMPWPALLAMSVFLAGFIVTIETQMVMRPGWYLNGLQVLATGGLEFPEASSARRKAWVAVGLRTLMALTFAQLSALIFGLLLFGTDISARLDLLYHQRNAGLLASITAMVDARITGASAAVDAQRTLTDQLAAQVTAIRQNQIDPTANDVEGKQAQTELSQLVAEKAKADEDLVASEAYAADELGGVAGGAHSGHAGAGPKHRAALERIAGAREHADALAASLNDARARLAAVKERLSTDTTSARQRAETQLPTFEKRLADENARLTALKDQQDKLNDDREAAIRKALLSSADYSAPETGLLGQMAALDAIAHDNPRVAALIIIVDLASFCLEMSAVASKSLVYVPTTYAGLIAREAYSGAVKLVEDMMAELRPDRTRTGPPSSRPGSPPANDNGGQGRLGLGSILDGANDPAPQPPKPRPGRPRGRPRKNTLN